MESGTAQVRGTVWGFLAVGWSHMNLEFDGAEGGTACLMDCREIRTAYRCPACGGVLIDKAREEYGRKKGYARAGALWGIPAGITVYGLKVHADGGVWNAAGTGNTVVGVITLIALGGIIGAALGWCLGEIFEGARLYFEWDKPPWWRRGRER